MWAARWREWVWVWVCVGVVVVVVSGWGVGGGGWRRVHVRARAAWGGRGASASAERCCGHTLRRPPIWSSDRWCAAMVMSRHLTRFWCVKLCSRLIISA